MAPEQWDLEGKISSDPEGFIGAVEAPLSVVVPREGNTVKEGNGTQQIDKRSVVRPNEETSSAGNWADPLTDGWRMSRRMAHFRIRKT